MKKNCRFYLKARATNKRPNSFSNPLKYAFTKFLNIIVLLCFKSNCVNSLKSVVFYKFFVTLWHQKINYELCIMN